MDYSRTLGLDFGTSYSTMSYLNPLTGFPEVLKNEQGNEKTPTLVYYGERETLYGQMAMSQMEDLMSYDDPQERQNMLDGLVRAVKMKLKNNKPLSFPFGKPKRPADIITDLMKHFKQSAETRHFHEPIDSLSLTYPVDFTEKEKNALKQCAVNAGFVHVEMEKEPISAIKGYLSKGSPIGNNILVFDLGGGTLDLAFIRRDEAGKFWALESMGARGCAGEDFDNIFYDHMRKQILDQDRIDINERGGGRDEIILSQCRKCKEKLSFQIEVLFSSIISSSSTGSIKRIALKISREQYEQWIQDKVREAIDLTRQALRRIKDKGYAIDSFLLIGDSTRTPLIKQELEKLCQSGELPVQIVETMTTDTAVALGALYTVQNNFSTAEKEPAQPAPAPAPAAPAQPAPAPAAPAPASAPKSNLKGNAPPRQIPAPEPAPKSNKQSDLPRSASLGEINYNAGLDLYCGRNGCSVNKAEALILIRKAARQGCEEAALFLSDIGDIDVNAPIGNPFSGNARPGKANNANPSAFASPTNQQASVNSADSLYEKGLKFYNGTGGRRNQESAVKFFRKAAEQGHAEAQCMLGICYYNGEGVREDKKEAVNWYFRSAAQGDASAQFMLGFCYENGDGVPINKAEAARWYRKAAEQGLAEAKEALDRLENPGILDSIFNFFK